MAALPTPLKLKDFDVSDPSCNRNIYLMFFRTDPDDSSSHKCKSCNKCFSQNIAKGYANLKSHITTCLPNSEWSKILFDYARPPDSRGSMDSYVTKKITPKAENIYKWMDWIITNDLPFTFVSNKTTEKYTSLKTMFRTTRALSPSSTDHVRNAAM